MADHVVDTNVLIVASSSDSASPAFDTDVPVQQRRVVFEWLAVFRNDPGRVAVLDQGFQIWKEYRNKLGDQDFGLRVMIEKLTTARFHNIGYDQDGLARLPAKLEAAVSDRSDRKFVAVALADQGRSTIVNATDTDWYDAEAALAPHGIHVEQIIDGWCRAKHRSKTGR